MGKALPAESLEFNRSFCLAGLTMNGLSHEEITCNQRQKSMTGRITKLLQALFLRVRFSCCSTAYYSSIMLPVCSHC